MLNLRNFGAKLIPLQREYVKDRKRDRQKVGYRKTDRSAKLERNKASIKDRHMHQHTHTHTHTHTYARTHVRTHTHTHTGQNKIRERQSQY